MKQNSYIRILFLTLLFSTIISGVYAEGSKDLYPPSATGKRASLMSRSRATPRPFDLFPTLGTMKVYVKAGETLYVGSSAQGISHTDVNGTWIGTINLRTPNGDTYTTGTNVSPGRIQNRTQELAGPNRSGVTTGYIPYTKVVTPDQEGIWEIDFVAPANPDTLSIKAYDVNADASWTQQTRAIVVAWDVSVGSISNPATLIPGRLFCNTLNLNIQQDAPANFGWYSKLYVLTKDGFLYNVNGKGQNGGGFNFFVNNKGIQDVSTGTANPASVPTLSWKNGNPAYKSIAFQDGYDPTSVQTNVYDPRLPDNGDIDITHKIFFDIPNTDLPPDASISYNGGSQATTWLRSAESDFPLLSDLKLFGYESGTENLIGPDGANIRFESNVIGRYTIKISAPGYTPKTLTGISEAGLNSIDWDGYDGATPSVKIVAATSLTLEGALTVGEIHFPMNDVENNPNGVIIELLNPNDEYKLYSPNKDIVYWNDPASIFTSPHSPASPKENLTGLSSNVNGHIWGSFTIPRDTLTRSSYGQNKLIDTWTLIKSNPVSISPIIKTLDLKVDAITSNVTSAAIGDTVTFTVIVSNPNTTGTYVDAVNSKFLLTGPNGFVITSLSSSGAGSLVKNVSTNGTNTISTLLDLTKGSTVTYTIKGTLNAPLTFDDSFNVTASIMRPADIFDIDATSSIIGPPTDALLECDGGTVGCNNIKSSANIIVKNKQPEAEDDEGTVPEDTTLTVALPGVLSNDTDTDVSDLLTVTMIRTGGTEGSGTAGTLGTALNGAYGTLTIYSDGSYSYNANNSITLAVGQTLTDVFNYTVSDGIATDTAILTITITENNSVPVPVTLDIVPEPEPYIFQ